MALNKRLKIFLEMIKFEHTIFALPFAYLGAFWAAGGTPTINQLIWVTVAMVGARTYAMSINRLVDNKIDAENPRTKNRALPLKLLSHKEVCLYATLSIVIFLIAVFQLSYLAKLLWPIVLAVFTIYPFLKRFFPLANLGLGLCLGLAPACAWVAVSNTISWPVVLISFGVFCWASGFDIIYACQDVDIDRSQHLYSIPACYGVKKGLMITKGLHVIAITSFAAAGYLSHLKYIYFIGLVVAGGLLLYENLIIKPNDLSKLDEAFFTVNSFFSVIISTFALIAILT
ncbi:MAG: 4-hydroxybenzoate octaprenyltransferase [Actinobacteria bacterium]|nr:MAG: 4-hydroxybenzoate octaprenyltransferase [Actinomycetota bacterium]